MTLRTSFASTAAAILAGSALCLAVPGTANADDTCQLGVSNVGPRSCVMNELRTAPVPTLGNGVCFGLVNVGGTAFDGPLNSPSVAPGATHSISLRISQGLLGNMAPALLTCDVNVIVDWRNLDNGATGSMTHFVPARHNSTYPFQVVAPTGPGRFQVTVRTDRPSLPASTEIVVP